MLPYLIVLALIIVAIYFIYLAITRVLPAIRTGRLQARGRIYERNEQPIRFWLGIVSWIGLSTLCAFMAVLAFYGIPTTP